jgi:hypothetical protein
MEVQTLGDCFFRRKPRVLVIVAGGAAVALAVARRGGGGAGRGRSLHPYIHEGFKQLNGAAD